MPRACSICVHPQRAEIDSTLTAGEASLRNIAERSGTSVTALHRHRKGCLGAAVAVAASMTEALSVESILSSVKELNAKTLAVLARAEAADKGALVLAAVREARGNVELLTRLLVLAEERAARASAAGPVCVRCDSGERPEPTVEDMAEAMAILLELTSDMGGFGEQVTVALARHGLAIVKVAAAAGGS